MSYKEIKKKLKTPKYVQKAQGWKVNNEFQSIIIFYLFTFFFDMSQKGRGWGGEIRTNDLHFIKRGSQPIEIKVPLETQNNNNKKTLNIFLEKIFIVQLLIGALIRHY